MKVKFVNAIILKFDRSANSLSAPRLTCQLVLSMTARHFRLFTPFKIIIIIIIIIY